MKIPVIHGFIERRILVNYVVDPAVASKIIPYPFRPKLYNGYAIAGICLIRLKQIKPKVIGGKFGISSENAAHRFAVEWNEDGAVKEGVYIPRRDTSSVMNSIAGGRIFPGTHYYSKFDIEEIADNYSVAFKHKDGTGISLKSKLAAGFSDESLFGSLDNASCFFENGSLGYSPDDKKFDGIKLKAYSWKVDPLEVSEVKSTFFDDTSIFPKDSIRFDNALLMRDIEHEWISMPTKH